MKLLVDVPDDVLLDALEEADVSDDDVAVDSTATDAVVTDALRAFVAIDGARECLDGRDDCEDALTGQAEPTGDEQWCNVAGEEASR